MPSFYSIDDNGELFDAIEIANSAIETARSSVKSTEASIGKAANDAKALTADDVPPHTLDAKAPHNPSPMTREELLAHLDAQQARTEAMLARQNAETAGHLARFEAQIDRGLVQMQVDRQDQKDEARTVRWTVITSTVAIFLALVGTVIAMVSLNSSVIGNVITAFQAGQATPAKQTEGAASAPSAGATTADKTPK